MKRKKQSTTYCYQCDDNVEYVEKNVEKKIEVRGLEISCVITECFCKKCGEPVFVESIEKINEIKVYDLYKKQKGLLTSKEIKHILKKRGMTQKELASFLSIGEKDITRYLNGSIQNKNIDKMLRLVNDDEAFERMLMIFEGKEALFDFQTTDLIGNYLDEIMRYYRVEKQIYAINENIGGKCYGKQNSTPVA